MIVNQLGNRVFEVGSDSSDRTYVVNMAGEHATCTCTAFAIARNRAQGAGKPPPPCKHVRQIEDTGAVSAVEDLKALLAEMTPAATPAPAPAPAEKDNGPVSLQSLMESLGQLVEMSAPTAVEVTEPVESEFVPNEQAIEKGRLALESYAPLVSYVDPQRPEEENGLPEDRVRDLLCDLMHACKADKVDFTYGLEMAQEHFDEEAGR